MERFTHEPLLQYLQLEQVLLQLPQWLSSVLVFTQLPLQQVSPLEQTLLQLPQWLSLLLRL